MLRPTLSAALDDLKTLLCGAVLLLTVLPALAADKLPSVPAFKRALDLSQ